MPVHTNTCNTHCTAGRKMTLRGNDVWLAKSDTSTQRKCFVWVDPILISQILAKWNCLFRRGNLQCGQLLHYWSDTLKSYLVQTLQSRKMDILKIWSQCLHNLQSYPEISTVTKWLQWPCWKSTIHHWIDDILSVMTTCNWENCVLLAAF